MRFLRSHRYAKILGIMLVLAALGGLMLATVSQAQKRSYVKQPPSPVKGLTGVAAPPPKQQVPGPAGPSGIPPGAHANVYRGRMLYMRECNVCHHYDAQGDGSYSTFTLPHPANLTAVRDAPAMTYSIVKRGIQGTAMPAHPYMDEQDFNDVLAYIKMQPLDTAGGYQWEYPWGTDRTPVPPGTAKSLYMTTCAGCHDANGTGKGMGAKDPYFWPKPANFHARSSDIGRLYYIITFGRPGTFMAPQKPKIQSGAARLALARYVAGFYDASSKDVIPTGPMKAHANMNGMFTTGNVKSGSTIADLFCVACHGGEVNGTFLAPRLSDREWRYGGGTDNAVFTIVSDGVPGKLMPGHKQFTELERWNVITYVRFRGGMPEPAAGGSATEVLPGQGKTAYVHISGLQFKPMSLMIEPGTTVVWVNEDQTAHTTTSNSWDPNMPGADQPGQWNSGPMNPGDRFSVVFNQPGVTRYYCMVHPAFMRGQIVVTSTDGD